MRILDKSELGLVAGGDCDCHCKYDSSRPSYDDYFAHAVILQSYGPVPYVTDCLEFCPKIRKGMGFASCSVIEKKSG